MKNIGRFLVFTLAALFVMGITIACGDDDELGTVTYTVTFNSNGGTPVPAAQRVERNALAIEPTGISYADHFLVGWFTDNTTFRNKWNFATPVTGNMTLYAQWLVPDSQVTLVASPSGGPVVTGATVILTATPSDAEIRYTIDGTTPSKTEGTIYTIPILIDDDLTIRAIAYRDQMTDSEIMMASYVLPGPDDLVIEFTVSGVDVTFLAPVATVIFESDYDGSEGDFSDIISLSDFDLSAGLTLDLATSQVLNGTRSVSLNLELSRNYNPAQTVEHTVSISSTANFFTAQTTATITQGKAVNTNLELTSFYASDVSPTITAEHTGIIERDGEMVFFFESEIQGSGNRIMPAFDFEAVDLNDYDFIEFDMTAVTRVAGNGAMKFIAHNFAMFLDHSRSVSGSDLVLMQIACQYDVNWLFQGAGVGGANRPLRDSYEDGTWINIHIPLKSSEFNEFIFNAVPGGAAPFYLDFEDYMDGNQTDSIRFQFVCHGTVSSLGDDIKGTYYIRNLKLGNK